MKAEELVFQRGDKWFFREPGYERFDGMTGKVFETVEHQDFEYETRADAMGHAHWYLNPPEEWFPPPPM
jgi:hypothetical protein